MSYSVNYSKRDCRNVLAFENNASTKRAGMAGGLFGAEFSDADDLPDNAAKVTQLRIGVTASTPSSIANVQVVFDNADPDKIDSTTRTIRRAAYGTEEQPTK